MKTIRLFGPIILSAIFIFPSCKKDNKSIDPIDNYNFSDTKSISIINNCNDFGFSLFKYLYTSRTDSNVMLSPVSVALALGMTYNGTAGTTRQAFETTLCLSGLSQHDVNRVYSNLMNHLLIADPNLLVAIANSIWYRNTFSVEQMFLDTNHFYYNAAINPLDFSDPGAKDIINSWVAAQTRNKIPEIINQITPDDMMFLINAVYFKGSWKYRFDPTQTTAMSFDLGNGTNVNANMMFQEDTFPEFQNNIFSAIELPYTLNKFSMIIMLPKSGKTINDIITNLSSQNWNDWLNSFAERDMKVYLPRFKFATDKTLNAALSALGMGIAFTDGADFSGINPNVGLQITEVKHKTYIEVNEEGTEAAAVISIGIGTTSLPDNQFMANHPFLFAIKDNKSEAVVFIGVLGNPSVE